MLNASGTATGVAPVSVHYSLNGGAWTAANGSTNWSATGLALTPSTNTFSAYAQDASGVSKTNTVKFIYVVNVPITVEIDGQGAVSPISNGELLQIGKEYSFGVKAAKGFANTIVLLNGNPAGIGPHFFFNMQSNLMILAAFHDATRPTCVVLSPAVKQSVSNSPITVTGRASDNVGVTGVNYQLNGGGWNAAILVDGTNWQAADLTLNAGSNVVEAFAHDAVNNISLTNKVAFNYVSNAPPPPVGPAPASLAGTVGEVMADGDSGPFFVSFGLSTFAQASTNGNEDSNLGNYSYTLLSSNTAQLNLTTILPPTDSGGGGQVLLTFTDNSNATFADTNGHNGSIIFSAASNSAPSPSSIITAQYVGSSGDTNIIMFGGGIFTNIDAFGDTNWGSYSLQSFSSQDLMLTENFMDDALFGDTGYVQLDFSGAGMGNFTFNQFDGLGNFLANDSGTFNIIDSTSQPAGHAPDSLAGLIWAVTPSSGSSFQFCFGTSTYSRTSTDTNKDEVGDYSYVKTGANTAQFTQVETAPLSGGPGGNGGSGSSLVYLTYSSSTSATFLVTNVDNGITNVENGSIKISAANNFAPTSVAGKTLKASLSGKTATVVLNTDGTLAYSDSTGNDHSGVYTYSQSSPIGGMLVSLNTSGPDTGSTTYVELTFTSSTGGNVVTIPFDSLGNPQSIHSGTFTLK